MRHRKSMNRLPQKPGHARMLKRNLVTSLLLYEKVRTTQKRARIIAPQIDRLIAVAKGKSPVNAIRAINRVVTDTHASKKIMEVLVKRFAKRSSGLTRIVPLGARKGDGARMVEIELLDSPSLTPSPKK